MKKLSKLKLKDYHEMSDFEMKNLVGGDDTDYACQSKSGLGSRSCSATCRPINKWDPKLNTFVPVKRSCERTLMYIPNYPNDNGSYGTDWTSCSCR